MNTGNKRSRSPAPGAIRQRLPLITLNKTFLLTKINFNRKTYNSLLIYNDYAKKITCFEVITHLNLVLITTNDQRLFRYKMLEANGKLYDEQSIGLSGSVKQIYQISMTKIIVPVFKGDHTMLTIIDPESLRILLELKLKEKVPVNTIAYFDEKYLFVLVPTVSKKNTPAEKVYLYNSSITSPRRCFMLSGSQIIDCCMPTAKNLFVGSSPNELKFFKVNFGSEKPFLFDFSMKLKAEVRSLEIFHKNDNILLANCFDSVSKSVIFIVNTLTKETINTIRPQASFLVKALATITILSKKPEIYLMAFSDNEIRMCDIDSNALQEKLPREPGDNFTFATGKAHFKFVKIVSQKKNGKIKFLALTQQGLLLLNLN